MLFFSKRKELKKRKAQLESDVNEFKTIVKNIMTGIYKFDECMQRIIDVGDVSLHTAMFITRSTDDLFVLFQLYRNNRFFHISNNKIISEKLDILKEIGTRIKNNAEDLQIMIENHKMTIKGLKACDNADVEISGDTVAEVHGKILELTLMINKKMFDIRTDHVVFRSTLISLRGIVSRDYIPIISGVDIPLLYEDYESEVNQYLTNEILFDKVEIEKISSNKGGTKDE